jgi:hypothetical protein
VVRPDGRRNRVNRGCVFIDPSVSRPQTLPTKCRRDLETTMQMDDLTPVERRQSIFADLVRAQDEGKPVKTSRALVAGKWGVTVRDVETIEREGLKYQWPPLG